jgi:hypothetical protein
VIIQIPKYGCAFGARDSVMTKKLSYKPEGRDFVNRGDELHLSVYLILPAALGLGVYSASVRNEYQGQKYKIFLGSRVRPVCEADNLTAICEQNFYITWDPQHLTTL